MSSGADPTQRRERFPFSCHICGRRSVVMCGRGPGEQEPADLGRCSLCGRWACPDHYTGIFRAGRAGFICDVCAQAEQARAARHRRLLGCPLPFAGALAFLCEVLLLRAACRRR
jgi:hypothetical protein